MIKYICGVDLQHELEHGAHFYSSLEEIKIYSSCWEECGIVEIEFDGPNYPMTREEIKSVKWIVEQDFGFGISKKDPKENTQSDQ